MKRAEETVALYKDNFERTDLAPHKYERRTTIDQTYLLQNRVPFKKMTAVGGFKKIMLEEAIERNITLSADEQKKHSVVKKKLKEHEDNCESFKPKLPYERFKWY